MRPLTFAAIVLAATVPARAEDPPRTITTSGDAVVYVVPDEVILSLGVETFAAKLDDAKRQNDERSATLVQAVKAGGVEERHIQTDTLELEIVYRGNRPSEGINGYIARRAYSVTLKDPKKLGALLDSVLRSGANQLNGIDYRTTSLRKHRDDARKMAIKAAKEKADALAAELDCAAGRPRTINEGYGGYNPYRSGRGNAMAQNAMQSSAGAGEGGETTPLGQIAVTAQVTVTFDLNLR